MGIVEDALARQAERVSTFKPIDYERMNKVRPKQKAALTRAVNAYERAAANHDRFDPETKAMTDARDKLAIVCRDAVREWNEIGAWPDDWNRWQNALNDTLPYYENIRLEDL